MKYTDEQLERVYGLIRWTRPFVVDKKSNGKRYTPWCFPEILDSLLSPDGTIAIQKFFCRAGYAVMLRETTLGHGINLLIKRVMFKAGQTKDMEDINPDTSETIGEAMLKAAVKYTESQCATSS